MKWKSFAQLAAVVGGFTLLWAEPRPGNAQSASPVTAPTPNMSVQRAAPQGAARPIDDLAGMTFSDEQKAEIDRIHRQTEANRELILKDAQLTADQKDAMIAGYGRLEGGLIFKILTPEQQKQVRAKIMARRAADSPKKKEPQARR